MKAELGASNERLRDLWSEIVHRDDLSAQPSRQIVAVCRRLRSQRDVRLRGDLVLHLTERAERILRPMVSPDWRDGEFDPVREVVEDMVEAILNPRSADGAGFEASFKGKLRFRLIDKIRRRRRRRDIEQPVPCDIEGEPIEPSDLASLNPEDEAIVASVLAQLPEKYRLAFKLRRQGFDYSSDRGESISGMLKITPKTAKDWVDRATKRILLELGRTP